MIILSSYIWIEIYVDRDKNMILVPVKMTEAGYGLSVEPYKRIAHTDWDNVSKYIVEMVQEVSRDPITKAAESNVINQICGNIGYKQFTKKHICIGVEYNLDKKTISISNCPRLSNGGYGVRKETLSEKYSIKYVSVCDMILIQANFLKAYKDAEVYLKEIGGSL
jgi:hypothetical protein